MWEISDNSYIVYFLAKNNNICWAFLQERESFVLCEARNFLSNIFDFDSFTFKKLGSFIIYRKSRVNFKCVNEYEIEKKRGIYISNPG